jgi:hypothetical protein
VGGLIAFVVILTLFITKKCEQERLEGTWRAVCIREEITFDGSSFIRGRETGDFILRLNMIYFSSVCSGYPIRITDGYIVLNSIHYLRTCESH